MRLFLLALYPLCFSQQVSAKQTHTDIVEIEFQETLEIQGNIKNLKNICRPIFGDPNKIFSEVLKLQGRLLKFSNQLVQLNNHKSFAEMSRLNAIWRPLKRERDFLIIKLNCVRSISSKPCQTLSYYKEFDKNEDFIKEKMKKKEEIIPGSKTLWIEWRGLNEGFIDADRKHSKNVHEDNHLIAKATSVTEEERKILSSQFRLLNSKSRAIGFQSGELNEKSQVLAAEFNQLMVESLRLQRIFYFSLRGKYVSIYALKELLSVFKQMIFLRKKQITLTKKRVALNKKLIPIREEQITSLRKLIPAFKAMLSYYTEGTNYQNRK